MNDLRSCNGVGRWLRTVGPKGRRQDTAHTYLEKLLDGKPKDNLHILIHHNVTRVIFDQNKRATGVEFCPNLAVHPVQKDQRRIVKAKKLVVLSCGALATPVVLEFSGIGGVETLKEAGISMVANVPGVGHNYRDHTVIPVAYKTALQPHETNNALAHKKITLQQAELDGDTRTLWNTVDVAAKIRPTDTEVVQLGSKFQEAWDQDFRLQKSKPLMLLSFLPA